MTSAITDQGIAGVEPPRRSTVLRPLQSNMPITISTSPTATAPKGRIIDDSARGTIFWEADTAKDANDGQLDGATDQTGPGESPGEGTLTNAPSFGKPFKIAWLSTERLPFYRTRGLRNAWNANREVKIARDGTELEPSVGKRLIAMFHRPQIPSQSPLSLRSQGAPSSWNYSGSYT